jgi:HD domain/GAF domain
MSEDNPKGEHSAIAEVARKLRHSIFIAAFVIAVLFAIILKYLFLHDSPYLRFLPDISITLITGITFFIALIGFILSVMISRQVIRMIKDYKERFDRMLGIMRDLREEIYGDILLEKIMDHAISITNSDAGSVLLKDEDRLVFKIVRGEKPEALIGSSVGKGKGVAGWVAENGASLRVADTSADPRFSADIDSGAGDKIASILCAPLKTKAGVVGVIELLKRKGGHPYRARDEEIIVYLAEQAAFSLLRTKFVEDQKNYEIHVTDMLLETMDFHIPTKRGHSRRVARYANIIAKGLDMTDEARKRLYFGSLLHDVGFLKINQDETFRKEDFMLHPAIGHEMIKPINFYSDIAPFILYHHERYDGYGYPAKLKGEEIPLEARIIAIAESFDAMTSVTSYRIPVSFGEAIEELKLKAGTQFDPHLVEIFVNNIESWHAK